MLTDIRQTACLGSATINLSDLVYELGRLVGRDHVLPSGPESAEYLVDYTGHYGGPAITVQPAHPGEVCSVMELLHRVGIAFVAQGGNTGLVGGGVPRPGVAVVLSLRRLKQWYPHANNQITVGAGVTLAELRSAVAGDRHLQHLEFGVQIGASSATIGGMVATNAGGSKVIHYGTMREQVVGLEAVMPGGKIIRRGLDGLAKDNTGPPLQQWLCGSEGTLAVITAVRVKLQPKMACTATAMLVVPSIAAAISVTESLMSTFGNKQILRAVELLDAASMTLMRHSNVAPLRFDEPPPEHCAYLLVEVADNTDPIDLLGSAVEELYQKGLVTGSAIALDAASRKHQWEVREGISEALRLEGIQRNTPTLKLDVSLPVDRYVQFMHKFAEIAANVSPGSAWFVFGHVADGTAHLNGLGVHNPDQLTDAIVALVLNLGGSFSSEHGVGTQKVRFMPDDFSNLLRALRSAWGADLLNPGVLVTQE